MALQRKCIFLKKPLETLLMAQSQRNLFVESTLKCPVMSQLLMEKRNEKEGGKSLDFSTISLCMQKTFRKFNSILS